MRTNLISSISIIFTFWTSIATSQNISASRIKVEIEYHYSNSYITDEIDEDPMGRMGYEIAFTYFLKPGQGRWRTAIGIAYSRFGNSRENIWEDATPEREMLYGKFPISYDMWDDVHYVSFPFTIQYSMSKSSFLASAISMDYPIGTSFYRKRSSDDGAVVEINRDGFNTTKAYPWNTSIGFELKIGKTFPVNEKLQLVTGLKAKVYTLIAARSNDYFPHEEYERPYLTGIYLGLQF